MLLKGQGFTAVRLAAYGAFGAFMVALILLLPLRLVLATPLNAYEKLRPWIPLILMCVVALLIATEAPPSRREKIFLRLSSDPGIQSLEELEAPGERVTAAEAADHQGRLVFLEGTLIPSGGPWANLRDFTGTISVKFAGPATAGGEVRAYGIPTEARASGALLTRAIALAIFFLSGALGYVVLSYPGIMAINWYPAPVLVQSANGLVLFPLFTGLFGLPTLILSRATVQAIPPQDPDVRELGLEPHRRIRGVLSGTVAGALVGWFPGLSGGAAATLATAVGRGHGASEDEASGREYMVAIAGVNAATAFFTLTALFIILRPRSGSAAAIEELSSTAIAAWEPVANVPWALALFLLAAVVATALGLLYVLVLGRAFVRLLQAVPYRLPLDLTLLFLLAMLFLFSGPMGLAIAGVAAAVGVLPALLGVRRVHLMGALILPVILFLLGSGA